MLNCSFQKSDLMAAINTVSKAVPVRTTMTILECILLDASSSPIRLVSNDMELSIETAVEGDIIEKGKIAIDAKLFMEIIRKLPDSEVSIRANSSYQVEILCEKAVFHISGKNADEFPSVPEMEKNQYVILSPFTLKEMIRQTIFSISPNDSNKIMSGELLEVEDRFIRLTSLDGHRISIRRVELKESYQKVKAIVPGKALAEVSKILSGDKESEVVIYFGSNHILFSFDQTQVVSRLIDGEYFRIEQMLSSDYETKLTLNRRKLQDCIERSLLFVRENDKKPIIFDIQEDEVILSMNTMIGSMKEELPIHKEGKDLMIGFNPKFLQEALRVIDEEEIDLYMINSKAPCFIQDRERSYIYLILPVNFNVSR